MAEGLNNDSRIKKTLLNARVNLIFYLLSIFVSFFTRKILLDSLGSEFVGLTTTLQNLLGFLNLAELGIGSAIGYVLYKPIFDKDESKLNEIISVFGYIYRWIGMVIVAAGVVLSLFLPLIFKDTAIDMGVIYSVFYTFLATSMLGYFVNYKQTLLGADQRNYVVSGYMNTTIILTVVFQAILAYYTHNFYIWAVVELFFGVVFSLILNWKIAKTYPWLASDVKLGRGLLKKYPEIFKYTKQLFVHKIGGFVQFQTTPFLIYAYVSLNVVTLYGNYLMIIGKLSSLVSKVLSSLAASVGNLIAQGDEKMILKVYWEFMAMKMLIAGVLCFALFNLAGEFISIWLGAEYVLDSVVLLLLIVRLYIDLTRNTTDVFLNGYGLFYDTWSPIAESVIYIVAAIVGGSLWGLSGVLLGGVLSTLIIIWGWKPSFLFSKGFKLPLRCYWLPFLKDLAIYVVLALSATYFVDRYVTFVDPNRGYFDWSIYAAVITSLFSILYFIVLYITSKGMRDLVWRFVGRYFDH